MYIPNTSASGRTGQVVIFFLIVCNLFKIHFPLLHSCHDGWLYYLLYLVWLGRKFFQLAVKLAKILGRKCKSNWKVQATAPGTGDGTKCNLNGFMFYHKFDWEKHTYSEIRDTCEITQNLSEMTPHYRCFEFRYIKIRKFWKVVSCL